MTLSETDRSPHGDGGFDSGGGAVFRLVIPAIVAFLLQVPPAILALDRHSVSFVAVLTVAAAIIGPVALLGARRWPGQVVAIAGAAAIVGIVVEPIRGPGLQGPPVALMFAVFLAIARGARVWAFGAMAAIWVSILVVLASGDLVASPRRVVVLGVGMLIAVGAGEFARGRRDRRTRMRNENAELRRTAEQAERVRVARELHDVLAHSLSSINVQASMGLHLLQSQPERAGEALAAIKTASKDALDEVRGVIGVLRDGDGAPRVPEPGIDGIEALADPLRAAGIAVATRIGLSRKASAAVQLALYRIAQESLTNVLRHSSATLVSVTLGETPGGDVELTVSDDGSATAEPIAGRGLVGMAERASLLGGTFAAGPLPERGFRVHAVFPREAR